MRRDCSGLLLSNVQPMNAVPFLTAARRLRLPVVAHVASWDHTVGKGVISPHCDLYVVQNRVMEDDLRRYHGIAPERVRVTGWPQTDLFHRVRPRAEYDALLRRYGLDPGRPLVARRRQHAEQRALRGAVRRASRRVVGSAPRASACSFSSGPTRATPAGRSASRPQSGTRASCVQEASYSDIEELATLLQHADVVVCNAGTILLDALVGDRPAVCVLYDEGAPPGESWAAKNVVGEHYQELAASGAFYRAERFEEVVAGIERALEQPDELAAARRRAVEQVVGTVDGRAAERVVDAAAEILGEPVGMRLVMTLLARDEADVVDAQIAFHLHAGVDFVSRRTTRSSDGTTEILERYERAGVLRLIREPGDDMRQDEWVTRMARLAATDHGADWVINSDADEFWWPRGGSLKDVLATVPGTVRRRPRLLAPLPAAPGRRRVLRGAHDRAPRRRPPHPGDKETIFHAHQKVAHRAHAAGRDRGAGTTTPTAPGSSRSAPGIRSRSCTSRSARSPSSSARRDGGWLRSPGRTSRRCTRCCSTRRCVTAASPSLLRRRSRSTTRRSPAGSRTARSRSTPGFATRCARCATTTGRSSLPGRRAAARVPAPERRRGRGLRRRGVRARRDRRHRPRRAARARARAPARRARARSRSG